MDKKIEEKKNTHKKKLDVVAHAFDVHFGQAEIDRFHGLTGQLA